MRKSLAVAVAALSVAGVGALAPAAANAACLASAGCTSATVTINGGSTLAIAVPDGSVTPVNLATVATGATTASGSLGNVTVTDTRGALVATWTASAVSSAFTNSTTGGSTANETIAATNVTYSAGLGTAAAGQVGAFAPTGVTPVAVSAPVGAWAGAGNNTVSWNPTMAFVLLPSQVAGTYAGTITQSVS
jgi:hypothetical protein